MPDDEPPEKIWDEYDWERFLQQQDQKTEKYMELLEKYIDHPERDQIIAREMGWYHLLDQDGEKWAEEVDSHFDEIAAELDEPMSDEEAAMFDDEGFEAHPLYQTSFALTVWIDQFLEQHGDLQNHPAGVKLSTQASVASAKLAAALSDDDVDEIGMTIAYLKRALRATTLCLEAAAQLCHETGIGADGRGALNQRLFQIRDGIIDEMGKFRSEFRRRYEGQ
jgi:hypothetical protein